MDIDTHRLCRGCIGIREGAKVHKEILSLSHPPIATFYDPASLVYPPQSQARRVWAELLRIAVGLGLDNELFLYVETHIKSILGNHLEKGAAAAYLANALELAATVSATAGSPLPIVGGLGDAAVRAIRLIKGNLTASSDGADDADCLAMAIGFMATLSSLKGRLSNVDLERILSLLRRVGLRIYDAELQAGALWEHMVPANPIERMREGSATERLFPAGSGKGTVLFSAANASRADFSTALSVLRDYYHADEPAASGTLTNGQIAVDASYVDTTRATAARPSAWRVHKQIMSADVQYRIASVSQLFDKSNPTLIQSYCKSHDTTSCKKNILVVVDSFSNDIVSMVRGYFESHSATIGDFRVLPMHIPSTEKDMKAVLTVVDAAVQRTRTLCPRAFLLQVREEFLQAKF
ncbi:uncharacterized protein BDR25DRAFT_309169 [Lindgomyces ingoldianus]|uniref:Uncharacterized protein n=1 Tax=Lindgomyces ingoldianus TaxID=673940 RepID=A0ACB6RC25_9PLEO|nr:uncharacterized protein BDR25DRAFT_309169 [Lindgomyces ingoldianus]KAF2476799.1 hypothetical protein BDR25DRAFT_309169 [Lindgomyces ingoldianus]